MRDVDVSIVTHAPDFGLLQQLLASLAEGSAGRHLFVHDNSDDAHVATRIAGLAPLQAGGAFATVGVQRSPRNVGFGAGHNANAARGRAPWLLVVNPDCALEPDVLDRLLAAADEAPADVAALELRQIPYEHPKAYDAVTLETVWCSGAATLFRRRAFEAVGGFDERIFLYGEDVDLSWRLRAAGWRLLYQPGLGVVHRTYREPGEVKPLQVFGGVRTNLGLRLRYGSAVDVFCGLAMLAGEIAAAESFEGRRWGLVRAGLGFLGDAFHFATTRVRATPRFRAEFHGWSYERRRDGAFVETASRRTLPAAPNPRVSILIRTMDRPAALREALASCAHQTYGNLEVVVIEDGPPRSRDVVASFAGRLDVRYRATQERVGRARAGNLALADAGGEWLNFLDDDDVLFADHVEVLVQAAVKARAAAAYGLAWEAPRAPGEVAPALDRRRITRYRQDFDRLTLWHHNYLPIQSVLFHRRLYERHGGFLEDMDLLEDWNLWTRYSLEDEFVLVPKTTSEYRVPAEAGEAAARQARLDRAYADAVERQRELRVTYSPRAISEMADAYARSQTVVMVTRGDLRRFVGRHRAVARLAAYRPVGRRALRRMGWLK